MGLLLDFIYLLACVVLSPWLVYRFFAAGRRDFRMRFGFALGEPLRGSIWLHGSSAGEVSLLRPLVSVLERDYPDTPLVVSAFTSTGLVAARKLYSRHRVVPLPFDLSFVVARCLKRFDPRLLVVVESEFWPNFILQAHRRGIPIALVNGKMSEKSYKVHARMKLVTRVLALIDLLAVQTEEHAARLRALGVAEERLHVTGNMKYDLARAAVDREEGNELRRILGYNEGDVVVIGGSLHEQEDTALLTAFARARAAFSRTALILVPRYPLQTQAMEARARSCGYLAVRKTAVDAGRSSAPGPDGVLIVDTVGDLGRLYAAADIAFVGGSLFFRGANKGGHNLMEPAVLAVPVLFGPYNFSFKETVEDLLAADAGRLVRDTDELGVALVALVCDPQARHALGARAQQVVRAGQGATQRNYALLKEWLRTGS